jgi:ATP-dependent exoDNAse (exonuclease V) beta subunit
VAKVDEEGLPLTWYGAMKDALAGMEGWQADGVGGGMLAEGALVVAEAQAMAAVPDGAGWDAPLPALEVRQHVQTPELWRGEVIHMLLETLPAVAAARREDIGQRLAHEMAPAWDATTCRAAVAEAMGVMEALGWVFGPGSSAEVGVALDRGLGRIDRLVRTAEALWILDFKTEAQQPEGVPAAYRAQLLAYAAALATENRGIPVKAGVIWTRAAKLVEVDVSGAAH